MRRRLGNSVASDYVAELITDSLGLTVVREDHSEDPGEDVTVAVPRRKKRKKRKRPSSPEVESMNGENHNDDSVYDTHMSDI